MLREPFQHGLSIGRFLRILTDVGLGIWFFVAWIFGDITSMLGTASILIFNQALSANLNTGFTYQMMVLFQEWFRVTNRNIDSTRDILIYKQSMRDPRYDFGAPTKEHDILNGPGSVTQPFNDEPIGQKD